LVIVDRHVLFAEGLRRLLHDCEEVEAVAVATNEQESSRQIEAIDPDVVLLDPWLDGLGPFALLRKLRSIAPDRFCFWKTKSTRSMFGWLSSSRRTGS
jgi:DNA-binding NarL/FixJ family response regulator